MKRYDRLVADYVAESDRATSTDASHVKPDGGGGGGDNVVSSLLGSGSSSSNNCCPPQWAPVLIDDRSHVQSVLFLDNDEERREDHHHDDTEEVDEAPLEQKKEGQKSSSSSDEAGDTNVSTHDAVLSEKNCFSLFYGGDVALYLDLSSSSSSSSSSPSQKKNSLDMTCNVLRLHSLLRPASSGNLPQHIFGSQDDVDDPVVQQLKDPLRRNKFVETHFAALSSALMPTMKASSSSYDASVVSTTSSSPRCCCCCRFVQEEQETSSSLPVPANIDLHDARALFARPDLLDRYLYSYAILLNAFGWRLHDFQDGTVDRAHNWRERYAELPSVAASFVAPAVSGMLRSLIDMRLRKIAVKFAQFLFEELLAGRLLFLREVWERVWVPMVLAKEHRGPRSAETKSEEKKKNENEQRSNHKDEAVLGHEDAPLGWVFDEEQRELWLERLNRSSSSDDDDD